MGTSLSLRFPGSCENDIKMTLFQKTSLTQPQQRVPCTGDTSQRCLSGTPSHLGETQRVSSVQRSHVILTADLRRQDLYREGRSRVLKSVLPSYSESGILTHVLQDLLFKSYVGGVGKKNPNPPEKI